VAIVYFDSSAFVKLLVEEDGTDLAAALWDGCDAAVSSRPAYPEVRAALAAAGRADRLAAADQRRAEAAWEDYWAATRPVELTEPVTAHAGKAGRRARPTRSRRGPSGEFVSCRWRRDRVRRLGSAPAGRSPRGRRVLAPAR
jgi:predicted nucleic acid-binding protein